MSSTIWTQCGGTSNVRPLSGEACRVAEDRDRKNLRGLVDSDDEHDLLERLIDQSKPAKPAQTEFEHLHFLLWTPFRYRPQHPWGTRFGGVHDPAVWYGAEHEETALAEKAFYMLKLREDSAAEFTDAHQTLTSFRIPVSSEHSLDLLQPAFASCFDLIHNPSSHEHGQAFARDARTHGIEIIRFRSVRDPKHRSNFALLKPEAFAAHTPAPAGRRQWDVIVQASRVIYQRKNAMTLAKSRSPSMTFERAEFLVDGKFPMTGQSQ